MGSSPVAPTILLRKNLLTKLASRFFVCNAVCDIVCNRIKQRTFVALPLKKSVLSIILYFKKDLIVIKVSDVSVCLIILPD